MNDWKEYKLCEVAEIIGGGTPSTSNPAFWNGDIPWITPKDLAEHRDVYIKRGERNITEKGFQSSSARLLPKGTVLFSSRAPIGYIAISSNPVTTNQGFKSLVTKDIICNQFLYYLIKENTEKIKSHASGTTFMEISGSVLKNLSFRFPPLPEQQAIARILGALDDKIELNRQMNHTLETMAQTLFKSWFVDFDPVVAKSEGRKPYGMTDEVASLFPSKLVESELGMIPEGWEVCSLNKIVDIIDCLHSKKPEKTDKGKILLQLDNIRNDGLIDFPSVYYISDTDYTKWISRMEAMNGDCIITNVGRVGAVAQIPYGLTAALGRNMTGLRCKHEFKFPSFLIVLLLSETIKDEIERNTDHGTILNALNVKNIGCLRFVLSSKNIIQEIDNHLSKLRNKMELNLAESNGLSSLRDSLLPKLISGDIRIKDAEKLVERHI
jgi:type I restriction enzyme S subunit